MDRSFQDIRYTLRQFRAIPGFTAIAVLSLAVRTGANTAIFTLIDALMLKALPVREPGKLVSFGKVYQGQQAAKQLCKGFHRSPL